MLKSIRNSLIATSVLYVILGVILMVFPESSLKLACALIGVVTLAYGVVRAISYWRGDGSYANRFDLFVGAILGILGVFLLACPQFVVSLIPIALGVYILVDSVAAFKKSLDMKALGFEKWQISCLMAVVLAAFGVVMIINPFGAAASLTVFIGAGFLFDGVYTLINTIVADRVFRG